MSLFSDKQTPHPDQSQVAGAGAVAIQAQGSVTYNHGLSVSEVRELCELFLRENFPKLQEVARHAAEEHVRQFGQQLGDRVAQRLPALDASKFSDPDVQGMINDAVQTAARRGPAANDDILMELIVERVSAGTAPFKDVALAEAVHAVSKLTATQIAFLTHVLYIKNFGMPGAPLGAYEALAQQVARLVEPAQGLSSSQRLHIQYAGAGSFNTLIGIEEEALYAQLTKTNEHIATEPEVFAQLVKSSAPTWARLLHTFVEDKMVQCELTSVGQAIAIANMRKILPAMNYTTWLVE